MCRCGVPPLKVSDTRATLWRVLMRVTVSAMKEAEKKEESEEQTLFNFADFDIEKVMKRGAVLVASGGQVRVLVTRVIAVTDMYTGIR